MGTFQEKWVYRVFTVQRKWVLGERDLLCYYYTNHNANYDQYTKRKDEKSMNFKERTEIF